MAVRSYAGRSAGERIADRRAQLIAAGIELLGTGGATTVTMRAVVRQAGLSPRYYYESFEDHESFLLAVYDSVAGEVLRAALTAVAAPGGAERRLRAAFTAVTDLFASDPRLGRIMFRETLADPVLRQRGGDVVVQFVGAVTGHLPTTAGSDRVETELALKSLAGALVVLFLEWLDGRLAASQERLVEYGVALTLKLLPLAEETDV